MCTHCAQHRPIPRNTEDNFYKLPERERESKRITYEWLWIFLTVILEARRQESKPFKVLKEKISTIFYPPSYQLKQYFLRYAKYYLFPICISQGVSGRCHSNKIRGKKTNIWHIGIQGGTEFQERKGQEVKGTLECQQCIRSKNCEPRDRHWGPSALRFLLPLCQQTA